MGKGGRPRKLSTFEGNPIREAIWVALNRWEEDPTGVNKRKIWILADRLVNDAIDGNEQARKEILDRIDGKVTASVQLGGENGLQITVNTGIDRSAPVIPAPTAGSVIAGEAKDITPKPLKDNDK